MATRQEIAEAVAILTGGRIAQVGAGVIQKTRAETRAFRALSRGAQARAAGAAAVRGGKFVGRQAVTKNPWGIAALLVYEGYVHKDELVDLATSLGGTMQEAVDFYQSETGTLPFIAAGMPPGRKVSKANKAVKHAMGLLKTGSKRSTGADKGKLPKGAFKMVVKAAGLANPKTTSVIGKGKSKLKALARKIKKWW